eukprot:gene23225-biopygen11813
MGPMDGTHQDIAHLWRFCEHFGAFWKQNPVEPGFVHCVKQTDIRAPAGNGSHGWHPQYFHRRICYSIRLAETCVLGGGGGWRIFEYFWSILEANPRLSLWILGHFLEHLEHFWSILEANSCRKLLRERVKQTDIRAPAENGSHGWHPQLCTKKRYFQFPPADLLEHPAGGKMHFGVVVAAQSHAHCANAFASSEKGTRFCGRMDTPSMAKGVMDGTRGCPQKCYTVRAAERAGYALISCRTLQSVFLPVWPPAATPRVGCLRI